MKQVLILSYKGLDIRKDSKGNMVIEEIIEDGAAFNDGFLQVSQNIMQCEPELNFSTLAWLHNTESERR